MTIEIAEMLLAYGYKTEGHLPSGWVLRAPDGRLIRESDFEKELEKLTVPKQDTERR